MIGRKYKIGQTRSTAKGPVAPPGVLPACCFHVLYDFLSPYFPVLADCHPAQPHLLCSQNHELWCQTGVHCGSCHSLRPCSLRLRGHADGSVAFTQVVRLPQRRRSLLPLHPFCPNLPAQPSECHREIPGF